MFQIPSSAQKELKRLGVGCITLFGSRAQGIETPLSDYDFAVLMNNPSAEPRHSLLSPLYEALYRILSPLCPRQFPNDIVDIVFFRRVPLELQTHIIRHGRVILDFNPDLRADEEARIMLKAADFAPLKRMMREALLARL